MRRRVLAVSLLKRLLPVILIVILIIGIYAITLFGFFVWEDSSLIVRNPFIKNISFVKELFLTPVFYFDSTLDFQLGYYRPVQLLSYMLDYRVWGLHPFGYHLTNILLHCSVVFLFIVLLQLLFNDKKIALLSGLFFGISPLHAESVSYIAGRPDLLAGFFALLCFILFLKGARTGRRRWFYLSLSMYVFGIFSRETVLMVPLLLGLMCVAVSLNGQSYCRLKSMRGWLIFFAAVTGVYLFWRFACLHLLGDRFSISSFFDWRKAVVFCQVIKEYLRLIFFPVDLYVMHRLLFVPVKAMNSFFPVGIVALFIYGIFWAYKKRKCVVFWGLCFFLLTLAPVYPLMMTHSSFFLKPSVRMAEHWLYFPLMGLFPCVAFFIVSVWRLKRGYILNRVIQCLVSVSVFGYVVFCSFQAFAYNVSFRKEIVIYERMVKYAPDYLLGRINLAICYAQENNFDAAIRSLSGFSFENLTNTFWVLNTYGKIFFLKGDYDKAIHAYTVCIKVINDKHTKNSSSDNALLGYTRDNLAMAYIFKGDYVSGRSACSNLINFHPSSMNGYFWLGIINLREKAYSAAVGNFEKSLQCAPHNTDILSNLLEAQQKNGELQKAKKTYSLLKKLDPNYE